MMTPVIIADFCSTSMSVKLNFFGLGVSLNSYYIIFRARAHISSKFLKVLTSNSWRPPTEYWIDISSCAYFVSEAVPVFFACCFGPWRTFRDARSKYAIFKGRFLWKSYVFMEVISMLVVSIEVGFVPFTKVRCLSVWFSKYACNGLKTGVPMEWLVYHTLGNTFDFGQSNGSLPQLNRLRNRFCHRGTC